MISRRSLLLSSFGLVLVALSPTTIATTPRRLVFVHGRSQQGKDPEVLKKTWFDALKKGAETAGLEIPADLEVAFPFYGDVLDEFTQQMNLPLTTDIQARGEGVINEDFLLFQAEMAEALRQQSGITDEQINLEYGDNIKQKGPLNWEWVQAILRALDKYAGGISQLSLELFTRDVFLYTRRSLVRETIDKIVAETMTQEPTVVVGHSLGSVVAYSVLRYDPRPLNVPLYVTVGSPLGIRSIRDQFRPLKGPGVGSWFNAFDNRDVVSLYPLDDSNFPVQPDVENYDAVRNHTKNRHGIVGYLDDTTVAERILQQLNS
ncbi:MAG: lipase family protein [Candidatus Thiodiazotropha sp. (ex Monitilora ramsayi)]|nr:lipase family protein [Candidatus Thiodiazotropha sp. (ex Monitilora ramsayi)]